MITQAAEVLADGVVEALGNGLDDEDAIVVRNATFAISRLGAKACTDSIIDQIGSQSLPLAPSRQGLEHRSVTTPRRPQGHGTGPRLPDVCTLGSSVEVR